MDFGTDRNANNFEADFDDQRITIKMFPVSERKERTFKPDRAEWEVAKSIYRQFAAETGHSPNPPIRGNSGDVWLVTAPQISRPYSLVCGAAEVDTQEPEPLLRWIWIHPSQRGGRTDSTRQLWEKLTAEYGNIVPELPCSPAMKRFLQKQSPMAEPTAGPYDSEPTQEIQAAAARHGGTSAAAHTRWSEAVEGLPLGEYDKRIVDWAARAMNHGTLWVFAGLLDRARQSGKTDAT